MPRDQRRHQQAAQRKAARRKEKHRSERASGTPGSRPAIRWAAGWPIEECLISRDWQMPGEIVQVLVARRGPDGRIAAGVFLVDLGCLGVKSAFARILDSAADYVAEIRSNVVAHQPMIPASLDLAAKVIREGLAYARELGCKPDRDYYEAAILLGDANPNACDVPVPLGKDGKPFFVNGPYDDVPRIIAQLERKVGPGNFDFVAFVGDPSELEIVDSDGEDA